jgi:hypothetical protein
MEFQSAWRTAAKRTAANTPELIKPSSIAHETTQWEAWIELSSAWSEKPWAS